MDVNIVCNEFAWRMSCMQISALSVTLALFQ